MEITQKDLSEQHIDKEPEMSEESPPRPSLEADDNAELFATVLAVLQKERLPTLAAVARRRHYPEFAGGDPTVEAPIYGSYHVVFPLTFGDGTRWLAKIPVNGTPEKWDELCSRTLSSEANTMRLLKRETTIPLPHVFDFSPTAANLIGCPYIIMSFLPGKALYDVWFGHCLGEKLSLETVENRRKRALNDIASAMAQLSKFSFTGGGSITFDEASDLVGVGPMRFMDDKAMLDRWLVDNNPCDDPIYVQSDVFAKSYDYYTFFLDRYTEDLPFPKGVTLLLRLLISWIPEFSADRPFVLAHPDFDIQNFLVTDDGELCGIIDWDGVAAVPRSIGCESYPGWLTRDWDSAMYGYQESMENGVEPEGVWEDSPATLRKYRRVYRDLMAEKLRLMGLEGPACGNENAGITRMSLITENLAIAAHSPRCRNGIIRKVVEEIKAVSEMSVELDFMDLVENLAEGGLADSVVDELKVGFERLLATENL